MNKEVDPGQWVERYGDLLFRYTLVRVKDQDVAEEIVQTTLLAALQAKNTFEGRSSEKSWLFGILKHKIMDHFRRLKQKRAYELTPEDDADPYEQAFDAHGHWIHPPRPWAYDPEKAAENKELTGALAECLDGLSEKFRSVFVLKEIDGMASEDICKEFGITPTNLWVILHRARNQLKRCLENRNIKGLS